MSRVLIVEDEEAIADLEKDYLELSGFTVEIENNGTAGLKRALSEEFDMFILDLMLPGTDGFEICKKIREEKNTPILMVSAKKDDIDKIRGLGLGADDYITKPFNILELKARIRALLRRANAAPQQKAQNTLLSAGGVTLDPEQRVALRDGKVVDLTAKEYDLIELFVKNPRRVYSRENLMDLVWGYTYAGDYRTVDVHIRRLREKLEDDPAAPQHILTKWGIGYYFKD